MRSTEIRQRTNVVLSYTPSSGVAIGGANLRLICGLRTGVIQFVVLTTLPMLSS